MPPRSRTSRRRNQTPPSSETVELSSSDFRNLLEQISLFARGSAPERPQTASVWDYIQSVSDVSRDDTNSDRDNEEYGLDWLRSEPTSVLADETPRRPRVRVQRNAERLPAVRNIIRRTYNQNPTRIKEKARQLNRNALLFEGLDNALIGVDVTTGNAVYEKNLIIAILMDRDHLSYEEADSFYETELEAIIDESDGPMIIDLGEDQGEELVTSKPTAKKKKKTTKKAAKVSPQISTNPILNIDL